MVRHRRRGESIEKAGQSLAVRIEVQKEALGEPWRARVGQGHPPSFKRFLPHLKITTTKPYYYIYLREGALHRAHVEI